LRLGIGAYPSSGALTLPQVLGSAKTLLGADRASLMLVDRTGAVRWASGAGRVVKAGAGLLASLLVAAATAPVPGGRLTDQLQETLAHWSLVQQAIQILVDREGLDAPAALGWLETAARSSGCALVQMARAVLAGAPLPSGRLAQAKAQRHTATDLAIAVHRRDAERHAGPAQRYERHGQAGPAQTERLQAAAARGRILDAEAEQRRADREP
jgi:hypothetical protein